MKLCGILSTPQFTTNKCVILCHGITVDKDEDGNFPSLTENLRKAGYNVARFDFRGHGESGGVLVNMTIKGEIDDLSSFLSFLKKRGHTKFALLGASLGAVASIFYCTDRSDISCLVLWYPVLDLRKTFLSPKLPWARKSFNKKGFKHLKRHGYLLLDGKYKIGKYLVKEMGNYKPYNTLQSIRVPVLTIHGDNDTYVPYDIARKFGKPNQKSQFLTIPGAEHGFGEPKELAFAIKKTLHWIRKYLK